MASKSSEPVWTPILRATAFNIVNQLADLWEVPVDARQATNDKADAFVLGLMDSATRRIMPSDQLKQAESTAAQSEPVESLEAIVIDCLDSARKGDDPNALGYYLMGEIDKALQKARIDTALRIREGGKKGVSGLHNGYEEAIDRELREESKE